MGACLHCMHKPGSNTTVTQPGNGQLPNTNEINGDPSVNHSTDTDGVVIQMPPGPRPSVVQTPGNYSSSPIISLFIYFIDLGNQSLTLETRSI